MNICSFIEQEIACWSAIQAPALMQRFILRNGKEFKAAPFSGERWEPKQCFYNAAHFREPGTMYAEGYAWRPGLPLLIHHAWRVTEDGTVIDPTWTDPEGCQYFGLEFTSEQFFRELSRLEHYGILDTMRGLNLRFMLERDPGLKEFFP